MARQTFPITTPPLTYVVADDQVASFGTLDAALAAAAEWGAGGSDRRIAVHRGDVRRAERLRDVAGADQILVSSPAAVADAVPAGYELVDLGVHRLRDLSPPVRIHELRPCGRGPGMRLRSLDAVPNNLPTYLTTFVGRDGELAEVAPLLAGHRTVTIAGPGGCGKTRLAAHAAAADDRWRDGVWWVELQAISEPGAVVEAVAAAIGVLVERAGATTRTLAAQLRDRRILVCLDNCEHVRDAAAEVAEALVRTCPEVTVLATSREPLGIAGEVVWRVPTLATAEALDLFVERGRLVRPGFAVDDTNAEAVSRLCAGLDGIPLAIELAAAWLGTLSPQQIAAGLGDRFGLLVRSARGAAARHRTLAASIDWSHDRLDATDRIVFRRLAVFVGGFTLDAAGAVAGDAGTPDAAVMTSLAALVDKSLVVADESDGATRYRLLDTIRHYAAQRLGEAGEDDAIRDRHLDHFVAVAEDAESVLDVDKDAWRARFEPERDNIRAALDSGLTTDDPDHGRRLAAATGWLWNLRGHGREGIAYLRRAIERSPNDRSLLQARLWAAMATVADTVDPGSNPAANAVELAGELGDERLRGRCLTFSAVATFYADFDAGWRQCEEALRCAAAVGDDSGSDSARALQAVILHLRDRHDQALAVIEEALAGLVRRADRGIASTISALGAASALYTGDHVRALELAEQAVELAEPLGDHHRVGAARSHLALVHGFGGDLAAALAMVDELARIVEDAGSDVFVPGMARILGLLHLWTGDCHTALRWLGPEAPGTGDVDDTYLDTLALPALAAALRRVGRRDEAAAYATRAAELARRIGMPRVLADALEQQGHLAAAEDPDGAADLHHDALALRVEHGLRPFWADSLDALGALLAITGRPDGAVRALGAADAARPVLGYPRRPVDQPEHERTLAALRATIGDVAFDEEWSAAAAMSLDDAVAYARRMRGTRGRPSSGWASLTPTELEVVRLVVEGLSNPEIAAKLFMGRGTVKTHLSHVFAKLGVANRTELATLAATRLAR